MKNNQLGLEIEQNIAAYVDEVKELLAPEIWQNILLDCSKNELFLLWLLYREKEVNMTRAAEYMNVPLNTATGIVGRMEKRDLVLRVRSAEDKRVVTIRLSEKGTEQIQSIISEMVYYGRKVLENFSREEMELFFRMMDKLKVVMKEEKEKKTQRRKVRKIPIS
ncbi:MarR family transcriptional regulator [Lachnospiraceae bacterium ASD3451]|uniref:MarR family winged helix-turn-helix transcriptional regulator n=1 Tax=Diplocloster agilis TaxID=2850323 RepID=UPI001DE3833A|nr:MarR family transcriptional regulator [Diplocloster agilis]MBU9743522.1 MarR family transcriptional regulator [Diplocloster agilis]